MSEPVTPLNRPVEGELVITTMPGRKGTYLAVYFPGCTYAVARFTSESGLDRFRRWVAGNKGRTLGGLRVER